LPFRTVFLDEAMGFHPFATSKFRKPQVIQQYFGKGMLSALTSIYSPGSATPVAA
jgi:hypothetical protein